MGKHKAPTHASEQMKHEFQGMNFDLTLTADIGNADKDFAKWLQDQTTPPLAKLHTYFDAPREPADPKFDVQGNEIPLTPEEEKQEKLNEAKRTLNDYILFYETFVNNLPRVQGDAYNPHFLRALQNELLGDPEAEEDDVRLMGVVDQNGKTFISSVDGFVPETDAFGQPLPKEETHNDLVGLTDAFGEEIFLSHHKGGLQKAIEDYNRLTNNADIDKPQIKALYTMLGNMEKAATTLGTYARAEISESTLAQNAALDECVTEINRYNADVRDYAKKCEELGVAAGDYRGAWAKSSLHEKEIEKLDQQIAEQKELLRKKNPDLREAERMMVERQTVLEAAEQEIANLDKNILENETEQKKHLTALQEKTKEYRALQEEIANAKALHEARYAKAYAPIQAMENALGTEAVIRAEELNDFATRMGQIMRGLVSAAFDKAPRDEIAENDFKLLRENFDNPESLVGKLEDPRAYQYIYHLRQFENAYTALHSREEAQEKVAELLDKYEADFKEYKEDRRLQRLKVDKPYFKERILDMFGALKTDLDNELFRVYPGYAQKRDALKTIENDKTQTLAYIEQLGDKRDSVDREMKIHKEMVVQFEDLANIPRNKKEELLKSVTPLKAEAEQFRKMYWAIVDKNAPIKNEIERLEKEKETHVKAIGELKELGTTLDQLTARQDTLEKKATALKSGLKNPARDDNRPDAAFAKTHYFISHLYDHIGRHSNSTEFSAMEKALASVTEHSMLLKHGIKTKTEFVDSLQTLRDSASAYLNAKDRQHFVLGTSLRHSRLNLARQIKSWCDVVVNDYRRDIAAEPDRAKEHLLRSTPMDVLLPLPNAEKIAAADAAFQTAPVQNAPVEELGLNAPNDPNLQNEPVVPDIPM